MALVNPNIAMSFKPTTEYQPRNVLAEYAQLQQIQGGQRQAEMADMQMQEYRQNKEALGRIQAAIVAKGGPPDLKAAANEMIKNPQYMDKGIQILETLKNTEAMDAYFNPPAAQPSNALAPPISGALGSGTFDPMAPAAPVNAMAPAAAPAAPVNQLGADRSSIEANIAQLGRINDPRAIAEVKRLERQLTAMEPTPDIKTMTALGYPATQEGFEAYRAAQRPDTLTFPQRKELAQAGRSTNPPAVQPLVAIVDPITGKQVYATRNQAMGQTPAAAMESLPPKEIQKREASFPQATSAVKGFEAKSDSFIRDLETLRNHPGLSNITGAIYGRTGSVSKEGSAAQALYDKVVAKGGFQALQDMRDASKSGGALGNVSNAEGKQLIASAAAVDRRQSKEDVQAALDQFIDDIKGSKTRMREAYDTTYQYKSGGTSAPAAANIDALLDKYK